MATAENHDTPAAAPQQRTRSPSEVEAAHGILPSHGIHINFPPTTDSGRPQLIKHMSTPAYQSPIRHHRRAPSRSKAVKETLNARTHYGSSDEDGPAVHKINQYYIKQEIGRGSFGAVHLAVDQYGHEFAVKEFSKSRLRKRAQSNLLRQGNNRRRPGNLAAGLGFNSPLHMSPSNKRLSTTAETSSLELIKEEIAIMKKLSHNNLVSLYEVLDDPDEDSLYMVLEMCKKGVVMKVGLDERAEPYQEEACRCWFRDMILGIEYLHAQGVVHRDIKPDNCLITHDDVLKIVDFGVSEMFEKASDMATAKSAGSPAFMPPELCVAKHGQVSGRAADIWSMGITLFCLRYGHIPFEKHGMLELYESIRGDELHLENEQDQRFADLIHRILEKDPDKRITMEEMREHPWVTRNGADPLLSAEENCSNLVEPPTEKEMNHAITNKMGHLFVVMKAVKRFKRLLGRKRPQLMESFFGRDSRVLSPPHSFRGSPDVVESRSVDAHDRRPLEQAITREGSRLRPIQKKRERPPVIYPSKTTGSRDVDLPSEENLKGHARDPLKDTLYLDIGVDADVPEGHGDAENPILSESPSAVDIDIYEQAYQDEMDRVLQQRGRSASLYLNRRVEHREDLRSYSNMLDQPKEAAKAAGSKAANIISDVAARKTPALVDIVKQARERYQTEADAGEDDGVKPDEDTTTGKDAEQKTTT
ncbi:hypothetical protein Q7P37_004919 [Cladosporium fusiforme]